MNALSNFIPKDERIITIEDSAELQIKGIANLVRLETKNASLEGKGQIIKICSGPFIIISVTVGSSNSPCNTSNPRMEL